MFNICILEGNLGLGNEKCWLNEEVIGISNYQNAHVDQKMLAVFTSYTITKEQLFFSLSHPNYYKLNNKKVYFSSNKLEHSETVFKPNEIQYIKIPPKDSFIGLTAKASSKIFEIDQLPAFEELFPYHLLFFHEQKDFIQFSNHMDQLCLDPNIHSLMEKLKKYRNENVKLLEESSWHKKQAEVLQTSLSLIRTEYQSDLKWYKDELEKVIQWYRKNHEELPPGISRLGKGINALRKRLRLRRN